MTPTPVLDTIALRVALQKLDHMAGRAPCKSAVAHARRTILLRLADAEAELAIIDALAPGLEKKEASEPFGLTYPMDLEDIQALEEGPADIPLDKLD